MCHTDAYEATFQRIAKRSNLTLKHLQLPQNRRVLLYGNSYMKQIVDELFCGNRFDVVESTSTDGTGRASHLVWYDPVRNATLVGVTNHAALQHSRALSSALPAFLRANAFDLIFHMPAHADCFFDYQQQLCMGRSAARCVDLSAATVARKEPPVRTRETRARGDLCSGTRASKRSWCAHGAAPKKSLAVGHPSGQT